MNQSKFIPFAFMFAFLALFLQSEQSLAVTHLPSSPSTQQFVVPNPPHVSGSAYFLVDVDSGKVLAEKNGYKKLPPASLTKIMTLYVVSHALKTGQIKLDDKVRISKKAWSIEGSRMFVKEGQQVRVEDLLKGAIVDSGNDACIALAEYIAGDEKSFAELMNQQAAELGMKQSHFTDSTGLPNKNHYSSAHDLAILSRAIVKDFPEYYHWYKQKWFTFNGIRQANRNRLLWRSPYVDGIKTGHTKEAGYCLAASAKKDNSRLISVILGAPSETVRADSSQRLLQYGFRFYETHELYPANTQISTIKIWRGEKNAVPVGIKKPLFITLPKGEFKNLNVSVKAPTNLSAPITREQVVGSLIISLNGQMITKPKDLIALSDVRKSGMFGQLSDGLKMKLSNFGLGSSN
jgi:D-alanyl-D-alanine carboxypeptidase (penicillin-binding protein 5/6)